MWEDSAQFPRERSRRVQVCAGAHGRAHAEQLCPELLLRLLLLLLTPSSSLSSLLLRATTEFQSHLSQPAEPIAPRFPCPQPPLPQIPAPGLLQTATAAKAATVCAGSETLLRSRSKSELRQQDSQHGDAELLFLAQFNCTNCVASLCRKCLGLLLVVPSCRLEFASGNSAVTDKSSLCRM